MHAVTTPLPWSAITLIHTLTFGELIVGVGTGLLALFTGYLGIETRKSARATQAAVETSEEPFVIATPTHGLEFMRLREHERPQSGVRPPFEIHRAFEDDGEDRYFVRLKLWNIGLGPAIVEQVHLRRGDADFVDGLDRFYPLGVGNSVDIEVRSSEWRNSCAATLTIIYKHASGRTYETNSEVTIEERIVHQVVTCLTYKRQRAPIERVRVRAAYRRRSR